MYLLDLLNDTNRNTFLHLSQAKIYYDTTILEQDWDNAYYMAPITGAVLSKIFNDYILNYPIRHPRYQPFNVVEKESGDSIIRSSSSEDFVWNIFQKLADMYVAIDPILVPKRYEVQLLVEDSSRDKELLDSTKVLSSEDVGTVDGTHERKRNVGNYAADFYLKFYSCIEAIKSGDYSEFEKTEAPTLSPTASSTQKPSTIPTPEHVTKQKESGPDDERRSPDPDEERANTGSMDGTNANKTVADGANTNHKNKKKNRKKNKKHTTSKEEVNSETQTDESLSESGERQLRELEVVTSTTEERIESIEAELKNDEPETTEEVDNNVLPFVDDAKSAAEEAEKAAEKAKEAANEIDDSKAAEAAGAAVEAAKKAAQATTDAAVQVATESLLSGDGDMMTHVIQTCFADPKYGIMNEPNEGSLRTTQVYLFGDGSHYQRLNLTAPYIRVATLSKPLPKPNLVPSGKGDVVDIGLALAIIGGFLFGIIVMLHHIRVLQWDNRLQFKWFFHPTSAPKRKRGGYSTNLDCDTADDDSMNFEEPEHLELSGRR